MTYGVGCVFDCGTAKVFADLALRLDDARLKGFHMKGLWRTSYETKLLARFCLNKGCHHVRAGDAAGLARGIGAMRVCTPALARCMHGYAWRRDTLDTVRRSGRVRLGRENSLRCSCFGWNMVVVCDFFLLCSRIFSYKGVLSSGRAVSSMRDGRER